LPLLQILTPHNSCQETHPEKAVVEFRLERLAEIDYLSTWSIGGSERYSLEPKSREYLVKHNLIS
jgi:hypothetical protein